MPRHQGRCSRVEPDSNQEVPARSRPIGTLLYSTGDPTAGKHGRYFQVCQTTRQHFFAAQRCILVSRHGAKVPPAMIDQAPTCSPVRSCNHNLLRLPQIRPKRPSQKTPVRRQVSRGREPGSSMTGAGCRLARPSSRCRQCPAFVVITPARKARPLQAGNRSRRRQIVEPTVERTAGTHAAPECERCQVRSRRSLRLMQSEYGQIIRPAPDTGKKSGADEAPLRRQRARFRHPAG